MKSDILNIVGSKTQTIYGTAGTGKSRLIDDMYNDETSDGNLCRVFSHSRKAVEDYFEYGSTIHSACSHLMGVYGLYYGDDEDFMREHVLYNMYLGTSDSDDVDIKNVSVKRKLDKLEVGVSKSLWDMIRNRYIGESFKWDRSRMRCVPKYDKLRTIYQQIIDERNGNVPTYIDNTSIFNSSKYKVNELQVDDFLYDIKRYEDWKKEKQVMDYTDLLLRVYMADVSPSENVIFVDEAQDLTPLQWSIMMRWVSKEDVRKCYIVGDVAQSIYAFQGTTPYGFLNFPSYKKPEVLPTIFRYGNAIWSRARQLVPYTLAPYNTSDINPDAENPKSDEVLDTVGEAELVGILETYSKSDLKDMALIAATNHQVYAINKTLEEYDITGFECSTMHGIKGDTKKRAITCLDIPDFWIKQVRNDISQIASMGFVAMTRAETTQINVRYMFKKGYHDLEDVIETAS